MKKTVLSLICVVLTAGAVYTYNSQTSEPTVTQVPSQQDTQIDTDSARDTFDYFLSGLGEADVDTLREHFRSYNAQQATAYQFDEDLFERFIQYRAALRDLDPGNINQLDADALRQLNDQLIQAQLQFFSYEEQQRLFAEENLQRDLALRKLELKQQTQDQEAYLSAWQQELNNLPPVMQESYRNASLLAQLQSTQSMDPQERYLNQQALVGPEAADRLAQLSQKRATFQTQLDEYFEQREMILADSGMASAEQQFALETLRNNTFTTSQRRRVKALESMRDTQGGQSID
ncbi:lipase secretion chaperone [Photobacterium sp. 53610]|uniref:lipase secretion chaperone n=1 Tax=Photobacterium sp. 53610 TaxID=3102789 RepID=UPI002ED825A7